VNLSGSLAESLARWTALETAAAGLLARVLAVALTVLVLLAAYRLVLRVIDRVLRRGDPGAPQALRRRTLASLLTNVARWVTGFIVVVVLLRELGIDVQALLVSAGVVGLAVGLGAQSLIRDVLTGFFLLFEGLIAVGDVIQVGPHTGTVESVGLRVTTLRLLDGSLRIVPNGALTEFATYASGWARAVVDVGVPRTVPVDRALAVMGQVGQDWAAATGAALDGPETQGIMRFSGADVVLRLMVKVPPARRLDAELELRRRLKEAFDREQWPAVGAG
jgi:small-conductance mechanosensitive channel